MREICSYGSVGGPVGNHRPYPAVHDDRAKRSPGEGEAERPKLPDRTQWVHWNPTRERMANPRKRVLRRRQQWRHEA